MGFRHRVIKILQNKRALSILENVDLIFDTLQLGKSGNAGSLDIFPATASKGRMRLTCTDQTGDTIAELKMAALSQARTITIPDPGADAEFMLTQGARTIAGAQSFTALLSLDNGTGAASANAILLGRGTSADPVTTSVADKKMIEFRCETTASSGDNRLMYLRYAMGGAGDGECLRAFTVVEANLGTAHGAHLSLVFSASAGGSECSGLGVACRATLHIPNVASWLPTGTYAAMNAQIFSDGSNSDPAGMTELSFLRMSNDGDATGKADVDTDAYLFSIQGFATAANSTKVIRTDSLVEMNTPNTVGLRIRIGSVSYYMLAVPAADWN